ncbi:MAG: peptidoglycan-associated lipoprotein Pal [Alphaproteobacteria bacterium]|nr:peptidoglycan-associated lipoprotein Pal [Alphaproteobacteria bacterium]
MRISKYLVIMILALAPVLVGCKGAGQKSSDDSSSGAAAPVAESLKPQEIEAAKPQEIEAAKPQDVVQSPEPAAVKNGGLKACASSTIISYDQYKTDIGDRVLFAYDKSDLNASAREVLNCQAAWLNANETFNVRIEGHCDERGTREYNIALGERRANAVKNYLVAKGVAASRLNTISFGKERPEIVGSSEESYKQNRRGVSVPEGL